MRSINDHESMPETEDHPVIQTVLAAKQAPSVGARMSVDYLRRSGSQIEITWLMDDPVGAWVVMAAVPNRAEPEYAIVYLWNTSRPDLPDPSRSLP